MSNASPPKLTPVKGLLILGAVVVVMGLFFALGQALGIVQLWAAFMFLMFWGNEKLQFEKLSACVLGALTGLVVAYIAHELPAALGPADDSSGDSRHECPQRPAGQASRQ